MIRRIFLIAFLFVFSVNDIVQAKDTVVVVQTEKEISKLDEKILEQRIQDGNYDVEKEKIRSEIQLKPKKGCRDHGK